MDKNSKYKFVFKCAKDFLNEIISKHPKLDNSLLKRHLEHEAKFENIQDAHRRLIESSGIDCFIIENIEHKRSDSK